MDISPDVSIAPFTNYASTSSFFTSCADVEWQLGFGFSIGDASDGIDKSHVSDDIVSSGLEVVADDCSCFVYCGPI